MMNKNNRWLLPEGIEEILPPKAIELEQLCRQLIDLLSSWGYEFVLPPMIEYLESLLTGTGEDLDLQTFKLTDQLNGRLMGFRADMTPQVARIDSHLLKKSVPTRLCYLGSVLHTRPSKSGETRAPLQVGAELYGHSGIASDMEIVKLMLETLSVAGIEKTYLDLGHIGIFQTLCDQSTLDKQQQSDVFDILQRKAKDELKAKLKELNIKDKASLSLLELIEMNGDNAVLDEAATCFNNISEEIMNAISELKTLVESIQQHSNVNINIDLAELRGYHYHTGMIYTAFVHGKGEGIAFGGRYDDIGKTFGRARPATGFSTDVKSLLKYRNYQHVQAEKIFAPCHDDAGLENEINSLRSNGRIVVRELNGQQASAVEMDCTHELILLNGEWSVTEVTTK